MGRNKWDLPKCILLPLPFLFLGAYLLDLPLPLPSILLPTRSYVALGSQVDDKAYWEARGKGEAFAVLEDRLVPLPVGSGPAAPTARPASPARPATPGRPPVRPIVDDIRSGIGAFSQARAVFGETPLTGEIEALRSAAAQAGVPLSIEILEAPPRSPILAFSRRFAPAERRIDFELLLTPDSRELRSIEVRGSGEAGASLLYRGSGAGLPPDRVLRLSAPRGEAASIELLAVGAAGSTSRQRLELGSEAEDTTRVLVISEKEAASSFVEGLYPTRRATPAQAAELELSSFELVVVDGVPIGKLRGSLLRGLVELVDSRSGSILFAADSPEFGKKGDNPELEELMPAILLPRSLKDLPDLAILILIDISGSMFGDKLSLAKVTGIELLRSLKSSDLVGMVVFSDSREWVYDFPVNSSIRAAPILEPITARGGTELHPAISEGLDRLARIPIKEKHIVVISDGVTKPGDFQALADQARSRGVTISTMGIGEDVNRPLLERLALRTGGRYYRVASADQIPALLFEDRTSVARPSFAQGRIPVLALNGSRVASVGGMAQYAPSPSASVIFTNDLGDPLLASREFGNRAVLLFASDLYGTYTADFFSSPSAAGAFRDRLDLLFAEKPLELRIAETGRGLNVIARSDLLVEPRLLLSREEGGRIEAPFERRGRIWSAEIAPPHLGPWKASIVDRGSAVASFSLNVNDALGGSRSEALASLLGHGRAAFRLVRSPGLWLLLFFAASLASTVLLRVKR
jgi:hypothetical protein